MVYIRLLAAELKAMAIKLPKIILGGGVLLSIVAVLIALINVYSLKSDSGKNVVAVAAPDSLFTNVAVNALSNMESVTQLCKIQRVSEIEAEAMVKENRASAALILGENFVEDIISGKNTSPRIIVNERGNELFMELAQRGSSILAIVQASIYAGEEAYYRASGNRLSAKLNKELNMEYIDRVFSREDTFRDISDNEKTVVDYYISRLLAVMLLIFSGSLGTVMYPLKRSFYKNLGVINLYGDLLQFLKVFIIFTAVVAVLSALGYVSFSILAIISLSLMATALFSLSENKLNSSLFILFFTAVIGFLGGAFLPPSLMGDFLRGFMVCSPIYIIGSQFLGTGCFVIETIVIWLICLLLIFLGGKRQ